MTNSVFTIGKPFWANACVGTNGFINYLTYAEGYSKASKLLLHYVLESHGNDIDSFIYPICFNMRHSIELRLKGAIEKLSILASIKKYPLSHFDLEQSHDINRIWDYFRKSSESIDGRFNVLNDLLDLTITDIGKIDATGQTFRYPFDTDKNRHLIDESSINCVILYKKFTEVEKNLDELEGFIRNLIEEYETGTFHSYFSRNQIFNLAKKLPLQCDWKTKLNKDEIKNSCNFTSNKQLIKVLDNIKNNYETSGLIGIRIKLKSITDDLLMDLAKAWTDLNPDYKNKKDLYIDEITIGGDSNSNELSKRFDDIKKYSQQMKVLYDKFLDKLCPQNIADLYALFYLSRDWYKYSESYIDLYEIHESELINSKRLKEDFEHVFKKPNFLENILRSLYFLSQYDIAEKIVNELDLEDYFTFLPKARDKSLFEKPKYLFYQ